MSRLDTNKLFIEFREGITSTDPIIARRYTLTHSDITAELFLTIGQNYAFDKITTQRDEVLGEWVEERGSFFYHAYLNVDGEMGYIMATMRDLIFRRELPLALEAIRYGDRELFNVHTELDYSPIIVYFLSTNPQFSRVENWGTFANYKIQDIF